LIYREPTPAAPMPSAGRVSLLHQPQKRRYVAHLLYAPALQRGRCLVIEDMVPLYNIAMALRVPEAILEVRLPLEGQDLLAERAGEAVHVTVPEVCGHQVVVFEY
jgi:hypothetical protein